MQKLDPIDHALHTLLEDELGGRTPPDLSGEILIRLQRERAAARASDPPLHERLGRAAARAIWTCVVSGHRKWWLLPILIAAALVGFALVLGTTGAAPFIYTMF
jgi:hypothetical protein